MKSQPWVPLQKAVVKPVSALQVREAMEHLGLDEAEARDILARGNSGEVWINNIYQVAVHRQKGMTHLNIRRRDGGPIFRDWRHFQAIKNQLVGEECEGIELYPAESRKVDTSNKYHIWVVNDPEFRFPVGWEKRLVDHTQHKSPGFKQRGSE